MWKLLLLLTGGAIGTALRYGVSLLVSRNITHTFPFGILTVNVLGSFLIGLCWSLAESLHFNTHLRLFLFTGLFGGFTTFSSFSLDTMELIKNAEYKLALLNILANNLFGIVAVFGGFALGRLLLAK